jgi:hypothetical protein
MTTDLAIAEIKNYLIEYLDEEIDIYIAGDIEDLIAPFIDITTTGSSEHEVLRGVLEINVRLRVATIPRVENTGRAIADELYDVIADSVQLIAWSDENNTTSRFFNAREYEMETRAENDMTISEITFTLTACKLYN